MVGGAIESLDTGCGRGYLIIRHRMWEGLLTGYLIIRHRMWEGLLTHCTPDVGGAHE